MSRDAIVQDTRISEPECTIVRFLSLSAYQKADLNHNRIGIMTRASVSQISLLSLCTLFSLSAFAEGMGFCTYKDQKIELNDGVAYHRPNVFDATKQDLRITLTVDKIDPAKIADSKDLEHTMLVQQGGKITLNLEGDSVTYMYSRFPDSSNVSNNSKSIGQLKLSNKDATRLSGTFQNKADSESEASCTLHFDVPVVR